MPFSRYLSNLMFACLSQPCSVFNKKNMNILKYGVKLITGEISSGRTVSLPDIFYPVLPHQGPGFLHLLVIVIECLKLSLHLVKHFVKSMLDIYRVVFQRNQMNRCRLGPSGWGTSQVGSGGTGLSELGIEASHLNHLIGSNSLCIHLGALHNDTLDMCLINFRTIQGCPSDGHNFLD